MQESIHKLDKKIIKWLNKHSENALRISLGIVFIWFGALKPLGLSPAAELVAQTVYWFDPKFFVSFLGIWEVVIGLCLLIKPLTRLGLLLLAAQMLGTFLPLIILPEVAFVKFPFVLSLEGQYIIKNLVLISAGMAIGSHIVALENE